MSIAVIEPPAAAIDLAMVKAHLRITSAAEDTILAVYIAAAQAMIDGPYGWLGRCIGVQTLELRLDQFPSAIWGWGYDPGGDGLFWDSSPSSGLAGLASGSLDLPYPPLISVTSVTYEDQDGVLQTLPSAAYLATDEGVDASFGTVFPSGRCEPGAVRIRYVAGYETMPAPIVAALLLMIGDLYSNRQTVETGVRAAAVSVPMSTTVESLLGPYRVFG